MVARAVGWSRVAIGGSALLAPGVATTVLGKEGPATARERLIVRAAGARDLAIGAGTVRAVNRGDDVAAWLAAGAACDAADAFAAATGGRELGRRRWLVALVALGGAALGAVLALTEE
jgi:hypothetical protein